MKLQRRRGHTHSLTLAVSSALMRTNSFRLCEPATSLPLVSIESSTHHHNNHLNLQITQIHIETHKHLTPSGSITFTRNTHPHTKYRVNDREGGKHRNLKAWGCWRMERVIKCSRLIKKASAFGGYNE